jgi:ABC-type polysaccharide/polyol phosphate export permease
VFITGLTLLLSTASTLFRDVKHLIEVGISVLFWTTPIVYEPTIPARFQRLALLSPMAPFITPTRTSSTTESPTASSGPSRSFAP